MNAGAIAVLVVMWVVVLITLGAVLITVRRHVIAQAQTRRVRAKLAAHASEWAALAASATAMAQKQPVDLSGGRGGRHRAAVVVGDPPDNLATTATHETRASLVRPYAPTALPALRPQGSVRHG